MERCRLPAIAAGTVLGAALALPLALDARVVTVAAAALLFAWLAYRKDATLGTLAVLSLAAGALDARIQLDLQPHVVAARTARYTGTVLGDVRSSDGLSSTFAFGVDGGPAMLVQANGPAPQTGAHLRIRARLEPFDDARNPGEPRETDLERERGLVARLATAQILAVLPPANDPRARLARARGWALRAVRARLPEPDASLIAGALWGERAALPPDLRAEFQETGTVHVLVTAGLHLGVVVALVLGLLAALRAPRVATCAIAIGAAWTYALVAGAHVPSVRAATMLSFALLARACGRKALGWHAYAGAALLLTLVRPLDVGGASFALSFACVGAILALAGPLDRALAVRWALPDRARETLAMAVATQAGTWPVGAAIFLQFSPYAVLANAAVVPVVGGAMLFALAQLAFSWVPSLAQACANLCDWCVIWMLAVVRSVSSLPYARVPMTPAPAWCIALYIAALLAVPLGLRRGKGALAVAALAGATALVLWPPRVPDARLRVTVLDVGQADAIVVQTPGGHTLLIDAGGQLERGAQSSGDSSAERVGERIVVPFLLRSGIHAVDALILSHPHGDHAGGMAPALRALRVGELADSGQTYGGSAYRDAIATARADGVPVVYPRAGAVWHDDDGVSLRFIGPSLPFLAHTGNDINDNSIAFVLEYKSFRMLFTGDAGVAAERRFLASGIDLRATVLKVGHHGSAYGTSDAFLTAIRPRYAIVSVGRHNHFGHPAPRTLAALRRIGATVYRTDEDGAVSVSTDGAATTVSPTEPTESTSDSPVFHNRRIQ
ncbi:MAG TPA: DNA internalization-related competence protein ComEC/Rec2 [Candidatus Baltobacteraceae bacterium]